MGPGRSGGSGGIRWGQVESSGVRWAQVGSGAWVGSDGLSRVRWGWSQVGSGGVRGAPVGLGGVRQGPAGSGGRGVRSRAPQEQVPSELSCADASVAPLARRGITVCGCDTHAGATPQPATGSTSPPSSESRKRGRPRPAPVPAEAGGDPSRAGAVRCARPSRSPRPGPRRPPFPRIYPPLHLWPART